MSQGDKPAEGHLVIRTTLHEPRKLGRQKKPGPLPSPSRPASHASQVPAPSPVAQRLALAYAIERAIESGRVKNLAEVSRRLGITRARVTQLVGLLFVAAPLQESVLTEHGSQSERTLRNLASNFDWRQQLIGITS